MSPKVPGHLLKASVRRLLYLDEHEAYLGAHRQHQFEVKSDSRCLARSFFHPFHSLVVIPARLRVSVGTVGARLIAVSNLG
ncbi:hypothetical protein PFLUV_G00008620 [Perca fluviatilis]|uniref:Uncharacterized protein n=1 Tax=Perca fluviatilis TaxID=8168 RepID=A0A6A5FHK6_PERFL|nr:hypothetical protein PFLUV_G00008620 [Perca fluviatilis]